MKKYTGILAVIIAMVFLFCSGYYTALHFNMKCGGKEQEADVAEQQAMADAASMDDEQGREEKTGAKGTGGKGEDRNGVVKTAGSGGWVEKEETWDREFEELLEKYVFGDWSFSRRIGVHDDGGFKLGEYYPNHYSEMDFSEQGVEEMKEIVMHYGRDSAGVAGGLGQTTFSNPIDICLFNVNACGFRKFSQPSYAMGMGAVRTGSYHYVEDGYPAGGGLVRICYGNSDTDWEESVKYVRDGDIYVDTSDTDTLYLDFCGFWELKRAGKELGAMDMGCEPDLTEEEKTFLEKHVYGDWEFYGRLYKLEDGERAGNVAEFNFSDQGVDELVDGKEIGISFEEAGGYIHCWQTALSNPEDAYLSCIYMVNGFWNAWHVWGEVDAGNIRLRNAFRKDDEYVSLEGKDRLVEISGDGGFSMDSFHGYYCGSHLYADPDDTETLYLDACGLWELKRAD